MLFGDGVHGARLPTGAANVTAAYRVGLGDRGQRLRRARSASPMTRPQGCRDVTNPLPSSGGADPDTADRARANAPLAVMALDRVVSVQDYQDFARRLGRHRQGQQRAAVRRPEPVRAPDHRRHDRPARRDDPRR